MIHYALRCEANHDFDGWFKSSTDFERLERRGLLSCPQCGTSAVERGMMAPHIGGKAIAEAITEPPRPASAPSPTARPQTAQPQSTPPQTMMTGPMPDAMRSLLARLRQAVETHCDYVGDKFADEARRIHEGDAPARGIYGEATADEAESLEAEGISVARIPWVPRTDS